MKSSVAPGNWPLVLGLGATCTIGYGTILYSFSLLSIEIGKAFSWSSQFIFGIYSLGILLSGLIAEKIGKRLDQSGARWPMCLGSLIVAACLFGLAGMTSKTEYVVFMLLLEGVSILVLYESAFVALTQEAGKGARRSISQVTLIAGFASTVFWPLVAKLLQYLDWRAVYVLMGLLHLIVCLPVHFWVLRPNPKRMADKRAVSGALSHRVGIQNRRIELFIGTAFGLAAFCIVGVQVHLFGLFSRLGVSEQLAILAGTLIGPFQVISRATDMLLSSYVNAPQMANISLVSMAIGLLFGISIDFISPYSALLFTIFFGIGQGLTNIVRGALPLHYFGELNYGSTTGRMNRLRLVLTAVSPVCIAFLLETLGAMNLLIFMCFLCLACVVLLRLADQMYKAG